MDKSEKEKIIMNEFSRLAGRRIKNNSLVVKLLDPNIYQVIRKDSKIVICRNALILLNGKNLEKEITFFRREVCLYFELIANVHKKIV